MKKRIFSKITGLGLALTLVLCAVPVPARADSVRVIQSGAVGVRKLSVDEMAKLLTAELLPSPGDFNEAPPSYAAPLSAGTLKEEHLKSGIDRLNALRRIAGLPDVELDGSCNELAQAAAFLNAANGVLSHEPSRPEGIDDALYELGTAGLSGSSIAISSIIPDIGPLAFSVDQWMSDSDSGNVDRLGHRRWQLNPAMTKTGFGVAPFRSGTGFFATEYVLDKGGDAPDYDIISWPASGFFPASESIFAPDFAWSVTLNPDKYAAPSPGDVTVTLTRESDGRTWTFRGSGYTPSNSGEYFNVDTNSYGVSNCIIFRPAGIDSYEGVYTVTVSGVRSKSGGAADFKYSVEFFDLDAVVTDPALPFSDVHVGDWFYPYVKAGAEAGLIDGTGGGRFSPDMELTLAQVVTFAARTAARFRGETDPTVNDWKAGAYDYCVVNGIISEVEYPYAALDSKATRLDVVRIMDPAIPASAKAEKISVPSGSIPDVRETDPYGGIIYAWYRAGILEGSGGGFFNKDDVMLRSAMAAVLCRISGLG